VDAQGSIVNFPHAEIASFTELSELRSAVQERDALIRQLVGELVRVNQFNRQLLANQHEVDERTPPDDGVHLQQIQELTDHAGRLAQELADSRQNQAELAARTQELEGHVHQLESQLASTRKELSAREAGLRGLIGKVSELSEDNRQLEKHLQEIPELYRRKFTERLGPVTEKIHSIQQENYRLQLEVQGMAQKLLAVQEVVARPLLPAAPAEQPEVGAAAPALETS
jgi:chromosome segregation ATPase